MFGRALNAIEKRTGFDLDGDGDVGETGGTGFVSRAANAFEKATGLDIDGDGDVGEENPVDRRKRAQKKQLVKQEEEEVEEQEEYDTGIYCDALGERVQGIDVQRVPRGPGVPRGPEPESVDPETWRMKRNLARMRAYKERIDEIDQEVDGDQEKEVAQWPGQPPPLRSRGAWPHFPQVPQDMWVEGEDPMVNQYHKYWHDPQQVIPPSRISTSYPVNKVENRLVFGIKDGQSI